MHATERPRTLGLLNYSELTVEQLDREFKAIVDEIRRRAAARGIDSRTVNRTDARSCSTTPDDHIDGTLATM